MITTEEIFRTRNEITDKDGGMARTPVDDRAFTSLAETTVREINKQGPGEAMGLLAAALVIAFEIGLQIGRKRATTELTNIVEGK